MQEISLFIQLLWKMGLPMDNKTLLLDRRPILFFLYVCFSMDLSNFHEKHHLLSLPLVENDIYRELTKDLIKSHY